MNSDDWALWTKVLDGYVPSEDERYVVAHLLVGDTGEDAQALFDCFEPSEALFDRFQECVARFSAPHAVGSVHNVRRQCELAQPWVDEVGRSAEVVGIRRLAAICEMPLESFVHTWPPHGLAWFSEWIVEIDTRVKDRLSVVPGGLALQSALLGYAANDIIAWHVLQELIPVEVQTEEYLKIMGIEVWVADSGPKVWVRPDFSEQT